MTDDHQRRAQDSERVAALETGYTNLVRDFDSLNQSVKGLADEMRSGFARITSAMSDNQRTPWATLASWAAVVLAIAGIIGSSYVRDLNRVERQQEKQTDLLITHILSDGHSTSLQRIKALETEVLQLDTSLQREMRMLDDRQRDSVAHLDQRLQREMQLQHEIHVPAINALNKDVETLNRRQLQTLQNFCPPVHTTQPIKVPEE